MSQTAPSQVQTETQLGFASGTGTENTAKSGSQKGKNEKNRLLTKQYRNIAYQIRSKGDDLADPGKSSRLEDMLQQVNKLSTQVERPSEQADDSEAFYELACKGAEMSKRVAAGKGRTINDFLRHLKAIYVTGESAQEETELNPNAFSWDRLGRDTSLYFYQVPGASCLLGPLDLLPKAKKQVQRLARKPVGKAVAPKELNSEAPEAKEKRETERNMEIMQVTLISKPEGVGYLELTMNHQSFAQFAENCFTLSFLVNNKYARFAKSQPNNQGGIVVFPNKPTKGKEANTENHQDRAQLILAYDMQDWEEWKQFVRPEDCLMPHRVELEDEAEAQATQLQADIDTHPVALETQDEDSEEESVASRKRKSLLLGQNDRGKTKKGQHRLSKAS